MFWTYILQNPNGRFYVGHTNNLSLRLANHNRTGNTCGKFTRRNGPWTLVWSEKHAERSAAVRREREIKRWKSSRLIRERLLSGRVPT